MSNFAAEGPAGRVARRRVAGWVLAVSILAAGVLATVAEVAGWFEPLNRFLYDAVFTLRGQRPSSDQIVIVGITDDDIKQFGRFPWTRAEQSVIFEKLAELGPSVVVADILYTDTTGDPDGDARLGQMLAACGRVVGAYQCDPRAEPESPPQTDLFKRSGDELGLNLSAAGWLNAGNIEPPIVPIAGAYERVGHVAAVLDSDAVVRRVPLFIRHRNQVVPSLGVQAALMHFNATDITLTDASLSIGSLPGGHRVWIPIDARGQMLIDYPGPLESSFVGVSVVQLMRGDVPDMRGKIVFVGLIATGQTDRFSTPVSANLPGVVVHASVASAILDGRIIRQAGPVEIAVAALLIAGLVGGAIRPGRPILSGTLLGCIVVASIAIAMGGMLGVGYWVPPTGPCVAAIFAAASIAGLSTLVHAGRSGAPVCAATPDVPPSVEPAPDGSQAATVTEADAPPAQRPDGSVYPRIEGYQIVGRLGRGGMGVVWRAIQLATQREVALKLMNGGAGVSQRARTRFAREVELAARLNHPNIATVYDSGVHRGVHFYAMELIEGIPVDRFTRQLHLSLPMVIRLVVTICRAVHHAHQRGVIHRDLKPSNILINADGRPVVLDFGLARPTEYSDSATDQTSEGVIAGTPAYMAPEQAAGQIDAIDPRTDIYAIGVLLYRLLTDQHPFDTTGGRSEILDRVRQAQIKPPSVHRPDIPPDLDAIVLRAMCRAPTARFDTAASLADALEAAIALPQSHDD